MDQERLEDKDKECELSSSKKNGNKATKVGKARKSSRKAKQHKFPYFWKIRPKKD